MIIAGAVIGLLFGCGVLFGVGSFRPNYRATAGVLRPHFETSTNPISVDPLRLLIGVLAGFGMLVWTRWPVIGAAGLAGGYFVPALLRSDRGMLCYVERTDAIATWIESIRDSIGAARGLEGAIHSTATNGPGAIRADLAVLVTQVDHGVGMREALVNLADRVDHRVLDQAIATIVLAIDGDATRIGPVLSEVASSSREMARNLTEVHSSRSSSRATTKMTIGIVVGALSLLFGFFRDMLAPYGTPFGQIVLAFFVAGFGGCLYWINSLSKHTQPARLIRPVMDENEVAP